MLSSSFDLSTCFLAALHAIDSMSKRPLDQKSPVRKRSSLKRPATKQTPQIPAKTEATMHDSENASILRCSDAAVQPDAATEHISIAWLSTSDDVTLEQYLHKEQYLHVEYFNADSWNMQKYFQYLDKEATAIGIANIDESAKLASRTRVKPLLAVPKERWNRCNSQHLTSFT